MANRLQIVLAGVAMTALSLVPVAAYAGAGGSLPAAGAAAGAGRVTEYCCATWTPREIGNGTKAVTVLDGTGCVSIDDSAANRNVCGSLTAAKCRGELFTPNTPPAGVVLRCLTP